MPPEDIGGKLKAALDAIVAAPDLRPQYDKAGHLLRTFCNIGAQRGAAAMGRTDLDIPNVEENADALYAILLKIGKRATPLEAVLHALDGGLAFAVMTSARLAAAHGHIAIVRPEGMQRSTTVNKDVPIVANIGIGDPDGPWITIGAIKTKRNWNCRASSAFPMKAKGDPDYFIL